MKKTLLILLTIILFFACKHELEKPTWNVDMIVPVVHSEMNISQMITDSSLTINEDYEGFISLVFQQEFIDMNLDTLIKIDAIADEKTHTLDSATFADVIIADTATIGEAINEIPLGTILLPNGSTSSIPAMPNIANGDTINIDASEYFKTMTLYKGMLIIELSNGYPTDISNVSLSLINSVNQNLIASFNFPLIPSGSIVSDSVSIAGQTIDENLLAVLDNMDINASNGPVLIDYSDAIITTITVSNIGITEATAIFPEQQLTETLKEHSFDLGSAQIKEIGIKSGTVTVNVLSTLPNGKMIYNIPSLTKNGISFTSGEMIVPEAINSDLTAFAFDFQEYTLDLTGETGRLGGDTINTIYTEAYTFIDSTGTLETINYTDSFYSFIEFDLTPEYAIGYLGQDTIIVDDNESNISVFNKILSGGINFETAKLSMNIKNFLGADLQLKFDALSTYNSETNTNVSAGFNFLSQFHHIPRATELPGPVPIVPSITDIELDADDMLEILPDKFKSKLNVFVNPFGPANIPDFLFPEYTIDASLNLEIPLSVIATDLTLIDTIETTINQTEEIEIDKMFVTIKNGFPFDAKINMILFDQNDNLIDTLFTNSQILSAKLDENNLVTESTTSTLSADYNQSGNIKKIITIASFNTVPTGEFVKIYSDYKLDISISAKFNKTIGN